MFRLISTCNLRCFVSENIGEGFIDQFGAEECRRVVVFKIGIFDKVHADDAAFLG